MGDDTNRSGRPINGLSPDAQKFVDEALADRPYAGVNRNYVEMAASERARQAMDEARSLTREAARKKYRNEDLVNALDRSRHLVEQESAFRQIGSATVRAQQEMRNLASSPNIAGGAVDMTRMPTASLQNIVTEQRANINNLGTAGISGVQSGHALDPDVRARVFGEMHSAAQTGARATAAMRMQKTMGLDTESLYTNAAKHVGGLAGKDLTDAEKKLVQTFNELEAAFKSGAESAHGLGLTFKDLKDNMGGGGGGGGSNRMAAWGGRFIQGAQALGAANDMFRYGAIQTPMALAQNAAGFANVVNQQYGDVMSATKGDGASMLRLLGGGYGFAQGFGSQLQTRERIAAGIDTAASGAATIGQGALAVANAKSGGVVGKLTGMGSSAGFMQSLSGTVNSGINLYHGTSAGQVGLQGQATAMEMFNALNAIPADLITAYSGHLQGATSSTRGAGGRLRASIYGDTMSTSFRSGMANMGVGPEELNSMIGVGVGALGSQFNTGMIAKARASERSGSLNMQQYFGALGSLANVGGGEKQLEVIMQSAVSKGMDSSKNVQAMVSATTAMSSASIATGVDVSGGAALAMSRATKGGTGADTFAIGTAQGTIGRLSQMFTSGNLTLSKSMMLGQLERKLPGIKGAELEILSTKVDMPTLQSILAGDESVIKGKGLDKVLMSGGKVNKGAIEAVGDVFFENTLNTSALGKISPTLLDRIKKKRKAGGAYDEEEQRAITQIGQLGGFSGEVMSTIFGGGYTGTATAGDEVAGEDFQRAAAKTGAKRVNQGAMAVGSERNLIEAVNAIADKFNPLEMTEKAATAAKDFSFSSVKFDSAVDKFEGAVKLFANHGSKDVLDKNKLLGQGDSTKQSSGGQNK